MLDDQALRESVDRALRLVRKGAIVERTKIFVGMPKEPRIREIQRKMLNKLVKMRALRKTVKEGEAGTFYVLDQIDVIDQILATDDSLIDFIWPGSGTPKDSDEPPAVTTEEVTQEQTAPVPALAPFIYGVTPVGVAPVMLDPYTIEETNRLLRELVMTMNAALQSVVYMRDQTDAIKKEVEELNRRNNATDLKLTQVLQKLGE